MKALRRLIHVVVIFLPAAKPGKCPKPWKGQNGICDRLGTTCRQDFHCRQDRKCCFNGCQNDCVPSGMEKYRKCSSWRPGRLFNSRRWEGHTNSRWELIRMGPLKSFFNYQLPHSSCYLNWTQLQRDNNNNKSGRTGEREALMLSHGFSWKTRVIYWWLYCYLSFIKSTVYVNRTTLSTVIRSLLGCFFGGRVALI